MLLWVVTCPRGGVGFTPNFLRPPSVEKETFPNNLHLFLWTTCSNSNFSQCFVMDFLFIGLFPNISTGFLKISEELPSLQAQ